MTEQEQPTSVQEEFQQLRESLKTLQIATLDSDDQPLASYAPYVRLEQNYYLYLSELAKHTVNLIANGSVSLLLIESEENCRNLFARRRIVLQGEARGQVSEEEIMEFCRENLAHYKVPGIVEFRGELPKTDVGKVSRRELREEAEDS